LYAGEEFVLQFRFSQQYPLESPEVMFVGTVPIHPHIYSNGHICLSILSDGWTPALTVQSVALSILSMLSSCQSNFFFFFRILSTTFFFHTYLLQTQNRERMSTG